MEGWESATARPATTPLPAHGLPPARRLAAGVGQAPTLSSSGAEAAGPGRPGPVRQTPSNFRCGWQPSTWAGWVCRDWRVPRACPRYPSGTATAGSLCRDRRPHSIAGKSPHAGALSVSCRPLHRPCWQTSRVPPMTSPSHPPVRHPPFLRRRWHGGQAGPGPAAQTRTWTSPAAGGPTPSCDALSAERVAGP